MGEPERAGRLVSKGETPRFTLTLSGAAYERLHHAAGLYDDSATDPVKRRLS